MAAQIDAPRDAGGGRMTNAWRASAPYRPLMVLMLVSSTASFAALGVLALFARNELGASDTEVTVNFALVAVASMVTLLATGHRSDRAGVRRLLVPASLAWLGIGYAILASVRSYPAMLAVGVVFFCAVGVPGAQLMAHARDLVDRQRDTATSTAVIALLRMLLSIGSFAGFGIGGLGLAYLGPRSLLQAVAVVCFGCVVLSWCLLRAGGTGAAGTPPPKLEEDTDEPVAVPTRTASGQRLLLVLAVVMVL